MQTSRDETRRRFPLCVYGSLSARDLDLSVRFKPISGRVDQAAGLVFRYRSPGDYYVVRANALEGNVVLYKVERGERSDLKPVGAGLFDCGKEARVPGREWSTLRVVARGSRFSVHLDGSHLFDAEDATFPDAGGIALWTKADRLIRRFVDPAATIPFVEPDEVAEVQRRDAATGFDPQGATYPHQDPRGRCSFEALAEERCAPDPALGARDGSGTIERSSSLCDALCASLRERVAQERAS